jgi:hypothetical protein
MSSFLVFDSKGGEIVGTKESPTHTKSTKSIFFIFSSGTLIQVEASIGYQAYKWLWS